ncbi:hypothetical protein [Brevibacillus porteri]|nr:hypothetical protein [Brevibacillus porteri]MED2130676.1 hypothetical protein [Brevibacillus porteri]MED2815843.1 hypothetical protein [Brevibacillus porteri]MED2895110.1 hypothetical protein [Brevibacillus porteri]
MIYRLPEIPPEEPQPEWYVEKTSSIIEQENRWFEYGMEFT